MAEEQVPKKFDLKLFILLIVPLIVLVIIIVVVKSSSGEKQTIDNTGIVPIPLEEKEELPTKKQTIYQQARDRKLREMELSGRGSEINKADYFDKLLDDKPEPVENKLETTLQQIVEIEDDEVEIKPKKITTKSEPQKTQKNYFESYTKIEPVEKKEVAEVATSSTTETDKKRRSMGVVTGGDGSSSGKESSNKQGGKRYFPVILDESLTIRENSSVVFLLLEDMKVGDVTFKKNSYLFGKAKGNNDKFDIQIEEIKNTDNSLINVKSNKIFIFDEKYSRGLAHEGKINKAAQDAGAETANETVSDIVGATRVTGYLAQKTMRGIGKTVSNVTQNKEAKISLSKGYKIYIKEDK